MLYCPPAFKVEETDEILDHIERSGLAMLVANGADGPLVSHVPMMLDRSRGAHGMLAGHLAKANGQWQNGDDAVPAWAVSVVPGRFIDMQLKAIVGFELEIASLEGKRKVSQNREAADRAGVAAGLDEQAGGAVMRDLVKARWMTGERCRL